MGQKPKTVADMVVTVPFGGFAADQATLGDRAADAAEYPGLPTSVYLPTDRPRPARLPSRDPNPPPQPPRVSVASMLQVPSAALGAAMGSLIGQAPEVGTTARLQKAVQAGAREGVRTPFRDTPTSPAQEAVKRGVADLEGLPGLAFDLLSDPVNLVGGDPITDVVKIAAVAGPGAVRGLSRLYSRLTEEVLPRLAKSQHPNKVRSVLKSFASADEVAATGLEDFLKAKGDQPVTLEEVQAHLKGNAFEMRETVRGQGDPKLAEASLKQDTLQRSVISPMAVWADTLDETHPVRDLLEGMQTDRPSALVHVERGWDEYLEPFAAVAEAPLLKKVEAWRLPSGEIALTGGRPRETAVEEMYIDLSTNQIHDRTVAMKMTAADTGTGAVIIPDPLLRQFPGSKTVGDLARNFGRVLQESEDLGGIGLDQIPTFAGPPKYERYTLPGDKRDYREVLIQMPEPSAAKLPPMRLSAARAAEAVPIVEKVSAAYPALRGWAPAGILENIHEVDGVLVPKNINKWVGDGHITEGEGDVLRRWYDDSHVDYETKQERAKLSMPRFKSGHWSEPDIVTHLRYDTRKVADSDALFVEEVQSDWDQAGREKGYQDPAALTRVKQEGDAALTELRQILVEHPNADVAAAIARDPEHAGVYARAVNETKLESLDKAARDLAKRLRLSVPHDTPAPPLAERLEGLRRVAEEKFNEASRLNSGVADQPFKGTKATELGVKRALLEAVDQGLDQVAWTTGKQQARRYGKLLEDVKRVEWVPSGRDGRGTLRIRQASSGGGSRDIDDLTPKQVAEYIGKEGAERLMQSRYTPAHETPQLLMDPSSPQAPDALSLETVQRLDKNYANSDEFIDFDNRRVKKAAFTASPSMVGNTEQNQRAADISWWGMDDMESPARRLYASKEEADAAVKRWAEDHPGNKFVLDTSENPLTIGSRGMDQQYDEVMVAQFNKLGKPYGAKAELVPMTGAGTGSQYLGVIEGGHVRDISRNDPPPYVYNYDEDDAHGFFIDTDVGPEEFEVLEVDDPSQVLDTLNQVYPTRAEAQSAFEALVQRLKTAKGGPPSPFRRVADGAFIEPYNAQTAEVILENVDDLQSFDGFRINLKGDDLAFWDALENGEIESNVFDRYLNRAYRTREEAATALGKIRAEAKRLWPAAEPEQVWRFSIPEKMRDALATRGLPLMAVAPIGLDEDATLEERAAAAGLGALAVVLGGTFGKGRQPAMQRMLDELKPVANLGKAAAKGANPEEAAVSLFKARGHTDSVAGMAQAMKDSGIKIPAKTAAEKQLASAYVKEMLKRAATPAGPAEGPFKAP